MIPSVKKKRSARARKPQSSEDELSYPLLAGLAVGAALMAAGVAVALGSSGPEAHSVVRDAEGKSLGVVLIREEGKVLHLTGELSGLKPGEHGFHVHEKGECVGPDFKSAGGHFAPAGKHHGLKSLERPHGGDFANVRADSRGKAKIDLKTTRLSIVGGARSVFKDGGTAIVVHAKADDQKSDPSGNSGDRVACGVIEKGPVAQ